MEPMVCQNETPYGIIPETVSQNWMDSWFPVLVDINDT